MAAVKLFVISEADYDLDVGRIVFYSLMFYWFSATHFEAYAEVPASLYLPAGPLSWLPAPTQPWIGVAQGVWLASLVLAALGLVTTASTWVAFLLGTYLLSLDWAFGNTHHSHHLLVLCLFAMACARPAQHLSLDRRWRGPVANPTDETWCLRICQLCWCLMYFNAGLAKLRHSGLAFFDGGNFREILLVTHRWYARGESPLHDVMRDAVYENGWLACLLAGSGLVLELLSPLAFLLRNRWRWLIIVGIATLQVGAYLLFYISGFKKLTAVYIFWIPWTRWSRSLRRRLRNSPADG